MRVAMQDGQIALSVRALQQRRSGCEEALIDHASLARQRVGEG
jgi:hypothetical protein